MSEQFSSPFAVVTGASRGIGLELARQLAERGHDVLIVAEDAAIERAAETLRETGAAVDALQADLATPIGVERLVDHLLRDERPIDVLALNAGVGVGGPFLENELDAELRLIALNVVSVVHLAKRLLPGMVARGSGRVLVTSSVAAESPHPFLAVYGASKSFVQSFAEAIRNELKDSGVTITALQPGATDTAFFDRAGMQDTAVAQSSKMDPADVARQGLEALFDGKDHVVSAKLKDKMQVAASKVMPERTLAEQTRKQTEPGSGVASSE